MRLFSQLVVSAVAGIVIAAVATALVLYAIFAAEDFTREALVELQGWTIVAICAGGALIASLLFLICGRKPLPTWVRPMALGSLAGTAAVAIATLVIARIFGGISPKMQAEYLYAGLVYGVPFGVVAGAIAGCIMSKEQTDHSSEDRCQR